MDLPLYLKRIQYFRPIKPDAQTLYGLQLAHMLHVPFENLDIERKRPIQLSEEALWNKIVVQKRGGFCYELNGLFAGLLKEIGFRVTHLNARVYNREGEPGIEFGHLALLVQTPDQSRRWLVDAGFGDSFNEPLIFEDPGEQAQGLRSYRLEKTPGGTILWRRNYDGSWERQYFFDLTPCSFPGDYESACLYHQTSPLSSFTRGSIISKATPDGRVSLEKERLIITRNGQRSERPVESKAEYQALLKQYFDITLSKEQT
ncbi:MAG TPA: arylamine N-acetyltransferase [Anaerolineales bacterium]|nr:arylamine N-acetyltransferase [Anaerolineales bacterium]